MEGEEVPCVLWAGARNEKGYGRVRVGKRVIGAHKAAWEKANGPVPAGMDVLHTCSHRHCVELRHLFLGQARRKRGKTGARGEQNGRAKLTTKQVREMRERYESGDGTQALLADDFNVSRGHVSHVVNRDSWAHVQDASLDR
jgi:hypothetical protein